MSQITLVIPCYNEAKRLILDEWTRLAKTHQGPLIFVNDGSKDETLQILEDFARPFADVHVLDLPQNGGKAEAVRQGLRHAMTLPDASPLVGFVDADLAVSVDEMLSFFKDLRSYPEASVFVGARVALAGRNIQRSPTRHYLGRVFSTLASLILRMAIYDTQCGIKVFEATPALAYALSEPFISRWAFDVELMGRLLIGAPHVDPVTTDAFVEVPLHSWIHVDGSKVHFKDMVQSLRDLMLIELDLRRRRTVAAA